MDSASAGLVVRQTTFAYGSRRWSRATKIRTAKARTAFVYSTRGRCRGP